MSVPPVSDLEWADKMIDKIKELKELPGVKLRGRRMRLAVEAIIHEIREADRGAA